MRFEGLPLFSRCVGYVAIRDAVIAIPAGILCRPISLPIAHQAIRKIGRCLPCQGQRQNGHHESDTPEAIRELLHDSLSLLKMGKTPRNSRYAPFSRYLGSAIVPGGCVPPGQISKRETRRGETALMHCRGTSKRKRKELEDSRKGVAHGYIVLPTATPATKDKWV